MVLRTVKIFENSEMIAKFSVEERSDGVFLSTKWIPSECYENDREVEERETYSAAVCDMLEKALHFSVIRSESLEMRDA